MEILVPARNEIKYCKGDHSNFALWNNLLLLRTIRLLYIQVQGGFDALDKVYGIIE